METERGSTRLHSLENSLWKKLGPVIRLNDERCRFQRGQQFSLQQYDIYLTKFQENIYNFVVLAYTLIIFVKID
jgi:hypothetical protein